jgi:hypothetical protein
MEICQVMGSNGFEELSDVALGQVSKLIMPTAATWRRAGGLDAGPIQSQKEAVEVGPFVHNLPVG